MTGDGANLEYDCWEAIFVSLRVLYITGEYPPMQGGVGAYTAELSAALVALGAEVSVLTAIHASQQTAEAGAMWDSGPRRAHWEAAARGEEVTRGEKGEIIARGVRVLPVMKHWGWGLWPRVLKHARELNVDWLHVQYQTAAFGMHPAINLAPWWWRRAGLQVAWTYHDLLVPYLFPKAGARLRRWITELPGRLVDLPIVTNEGDRLTLATRGLAAQKSPIGSNIAARDFAPAERQALRAARGYDRNLAAGRDPQTSSGRHSSEADVVVGYFGFLNRSKGGLTLVQTLDALVRAGVPARLLMIGERVGASDPTNYAYLQAVEAEITRLGLAARVAWTGRLDDAAVSAALAVCDVLLMPYEDGVSLRRGTLMAGLAHGCPIVTTYPVAPLPELTAGAHLLYVPPNDPQAAAQAVQAIINDADLAHRLRTGALQVAQGFTWQTIARQHRDFYGGISMAVW